VLAAAMLEALVGYPDALHRRVPHPVAWIGAVISGLELQLNQGVFGEPLRRIFGVMTLLTIVAISGGAGWALTRLGGPWGVVLVGTLGLAQRSLLDHVSAVAKPLSHGDLEEARATVSRIVGRDVEASTRSASPRPRSRAWPRASTTASLRRCSGLWSAACRACSSTRRSTPPTA
jgi:adenosylcobinamide-phosphate synthase